MGGIPTYTLSLVSPADAFDRFEDFEAAGPRDPGRRIAITPQILAREAQLAAERERRNLSQAQAWPEKAQLSEDNLRTIPLRSAAPGRVAGTRKIAVTGVKLPTCEKCGRVRHKGAVTKCCRACRRLDPPRSVAKICSKPKRERHPCAKGCGRLLRAGRDASCICCCCDKNYRQGRQKEYRKAYCRRRDERENKRCGECGELLRYRSTSGFCRKHLPAALFAKA